MCQRSTMCCSARKVSIVFSALVIFLGFLHFLNVVSGFRLLPDNGTARANSATASFGLLLGAYGIYAVMHDKVRWVQLYGYIFLGLTILKYLALVAAALNHNINGVVILSLNVPLSVCITLAAFAAARSMTPPVTTATPTAPVYEILSKA